MKQTYTDSLPPTQATAELIHHTPLSIVVLAARTCTATEDDWQGVSDAISDADRDMLVKRILTPRDADDPTRTPPHSSVLEHLTYTYRLSFSRAVLQEMSRHRVGVSPSVQSTRWALKRLVKRCTSEGKISTSLLENSITKTGEKYVDAWNLQQVIALTVKTDKIPNDILKYMVPDAFRTRGVYTFNARALCNLFVLRTDRNALWEFRQLAWAIYDALPVSHRFLYDNVIHERPEWLCQD